MGKGWGNRSFILFEIRIRKSKVSRRGKVERKYFETYLQEYHKSVEKFRKKYQTMLSDEAIFKKNWAKRIQQLREKTAEGGFN